MGKFKAMTESAEASRVLVKKMPEEQMPWVSVIMPVYNASEYLMESVLSILDQTYKNIELICIDDGSTDMSLKVLNKIKSNYPKRKMVIISQENSGPAAARNRGLDAATGDYIAFVDSDDRIEQNTYSVLVNTALKKDADIVVFGGTTFPNEMPLDHWITRKLTPPNKVYDKANAGKTALLREDSSKPFMWQHFIKRELIESEPRLRMNEDFELGEDQIFIFSYFPKAKKVVYIETKLYHYRVRESGSIMNKYNNMKTKKFDIHLGIVKNVLNYWQENNISDPSGEMVSYFLWFLNNDFQNFTQHLKIKYAKEIVNIFSSRDFDLFPCREYVFGIATEITTLAEKDIPDVLEELNAMEASVGLIEEEIKLTMASKAYKIGRLLTSKKKRIDEEWLTSFENKKIF
ncbi:MAG: glycosyltransferase family 2 protein [Ruminiclostridium sp.]|nr:glycosyltransferase family 2 protein [Ruminiclostridium sp.]